MIFHLWDEGIINDCEYFEEMSLQDILLDFINYPLWLWLDSDISKGDSAREYYLNELIGGFLHPPLIKEEQYQGDRGISFTLISSKDRYNELNEFRESLIDIIDRLSNGEENINYSSSPKGSDIKFKISIVNGEIRNTYIINSIDSYCLFALANLTQRDLLIKKCENCGDFFIPLSRSDEQYCDKVLRNGRSCKQVGWENKSKDDYVYAPYRKSYIKNYQYITRNKDKIPEDIYDLLYRDFLRWQNEATYNMELVRYSRINFGDFTKALSKYDKKLRYLVKYIKDAAEVSVEEFKDLLREV